MADDTPEQNDGRLTAGSRAEDTSVESLVDVVSDSNSATSVIRGHEAQHATLHSRARTYKRRRRWPWVIALLLLAGLLATSITMTYQMSERSEAWSQQVDDITATSYGLGDQLADSKAEGVRSADQIDLLEQQLSNSKDTVLKLSDEKAQWRDDTEFAQQQVEATETLLMTAASVANSLQRCSEGQSGLIDFIESAEEYTPEELVAYRESVTELCDNAAQANTDLQKALAE